MGFKLFNPLGMGILGKLKRGSEDVIILWDGITYQGVHVASTGIVMTNPLNYWSIIINVSNLDAGTQIRINMVSSGGQGRSAQVPELTEDVIAAVGGPDISPVFGYLNQGSATTYVISKFSADINTIVFLYTVVPNGEVDTVEVI